MGHGSKFVLQAFTVQTQEGLLHGCVVASVNGGRRLLLCSSCTGSLPQPLGGRGPDSRWRRLPGSLPQPLGGRGPDSRWRRLPRRTAVGGCSSARHALGRRLATATRRTRSRLPMAAARHNVGVALDSGGATQHSRGKWIRSFLLERARGCFL
jgi:hypothetical protein